MIQLPNELIAMVLEYFDPATLSPLSLACSQLHCIVIARLYSTLNILFGEKGADNSSLKMIRTFYENPSRRQLLRHIQISSPMRQTWIWEPVFRPFCLALTGLFASLPQNGLKSLVWRLRSPTRPDILPHLPRHITKLQLETTVIDHAIFFPTLRELHCIQIRSIEDTKWVDWHVLQGNLRRLHLCLDPAAVISQPFKRQEWPAYPRASLQFLTHLGLGYINVSHWPFEEMSSLRSLSLEQCIHVGTAFESILRASEGQLLLRELSLTLTNEPVDLKSFLGRLSQHAQLYKLRVWTAGPNNEYILPYVLRFKHSLRELELESRSIAIDARSVCLYSIQDLAEITSHCLLLRTLSIPLNINKENRKLLVSLVIFEPSFKLIIRSALSRQSKV